MGKWLVLTFSLLLFDVASATEPIRPLSIETIERLGKDMFRQDSAAWVGSDALMAKVKDSGAAGLRGWIVVETAKGQRVRFLRDVGQGLEAGYDVDVTPDLKTVVSEPTDRVLTKEEKANFAAWNTAFDGLRGQPVCRPNYNHLVLKDPESDGWLVWLMAPMTETGTIPIGGHYRFSVSADGRKIMRRDALSASCAIIPKPDESKGRPSANVMTHIVSDTPVETHVFLQMQNGTPLYVLAGAKVWAIDGGKIRDLGPLPEAK